MSIKIYMIRHGESEANVKGVLCGQLDSPLTSLGLSQAKLARNYLVQNQITVDLIYSSPLVRARSTAEIINYQNKPIHFVDELKETNTGKYSHILKQEYLNSYHGDIKYHGIFPDLSFIEGESLNQMIDRSYSWFKRLVLCEQNEDKKIILVAHRGPLAGILHRFFEIPLKNFPTFMLGNSTVTELEVSLDPVHGWLGHITGINKD